MYMEMRGQGVCGEGEWGDESEGLIFWTPKMIHPKNKIRTFPKIKLRRLKMHTRCKKDQNTTSRK